MRTQDILELTTLAVSKLVRAVELNERFQFLVITGKNGTEIGAFIGDFLGGVAKMRPCVVQWCDSIQSLVDLSREAAVDLNSLHILDLSSSDPASLEGTLRKLNGQRDALAGHKRTTIVIALTDPQRSKLAEYAPDLWSTVTITVLVPRADWPDTDRFGAWIDSSRLALDKLVLAEPSAAPRYRDGTCVFAYELDPQVSTSFVGLRAAMSRATGWTGWRPWWVPPDNVHTVGATDEGDLECWMYDENGAFPDPAHSDYWRANPCGRFFLVRGYLEDSVPNLKPGSKISPEIQILRVGEALAHAQQIGRLLAGRDSWVHFVVGWTGLRGRHLTGWPSEPTHPVPQVTSVGSLRASAVTTLGALAEDLPSVVHHLVSPLLDAFFEELSLDTVTRTIQRFRQGRD
jgi:hypothetical protein